MAKDTLYQYDTNASLNTDVGGVNVDEGMLPSGVNNAIREMMAHQKEFVTGAYLAGTNNVALGDAALSSGSLSGGNNTAVGSYALTSNTTASNNTAVGYQSIYSNTTGYNNSAIGYASLYTNTTGYHNTALGYYSLLTNSTGLGNTAVGAAALQTNSTGSQNVAVGADALISSTTASNNTAVGYQAGYSNTTGTIQAFGKKTLYSNTTGASNVAVGNDALLLNTTGSYNVAMGYDALALNTTASYSTAVGYNTGFNNTTGEQNVFLGYVTGYNNTTGTQNCFVGYGSGYLMTTGSKNTILGTFDGNQGGLDIRTGSNNIVLSDGDGNPRLYINSSGDLALGTNFNPHNTTNSGVSFYNDGYVLVGKDNDAPIYANRISSDGSVININKDGTTEGSISVSGTTVSYNGGHLSRWSRLADDSKDTSIIKGTVMTNLDEMVEWGDEDNEQLNKMAVSSVEGDANVAGVFVNWDNDDDWNDMNVAMTGDMVIRIAQGTTVARGDLLMSAGDGTAKPQGDDIVRSKTIAKVTSTNVSHTYDDGSYLVPCVLMAC